MTGCQVIQHTLPGQHIREYFHATATGEDEEFLLHIKQYVPYDDQPHDKPRKGLTLIAAHSNGYCKEVYEPLWDDLFTRLSQTGVLVNSIWMADVAHQGISGLLNEERLGSEPNWFDHSRDLLHMVNHFRKEITRPIIGVGHSMGSAQIVHLSILHPRLFHSLILLDAVLSTDPFRADPPLAQIATFRRDSWPTRAAAEKAVRNSKFYKSWDARAVDQVVKYGFRSSPHSDSMDETTMMTSKHQEAFTLARANFDDVGVKGVPTAQEKLTHADVWEDDLSKAPFYRPEMRIAFLELPNLRPSVLYVYGEKSPWANEKSVRAKVESTGMGLGGSGGHAAGRVVSEICPGGHFFPFETPAVTADVLGKRIGMEVHRWNEEERIMDGRWAEKSKEQRQRVDSRWVEEMRAWKGMTPDSKL